MRRGAVSVEAARQRNLLADHKRVKVSWTSASLAGVVVLAVIAVASGALLNSRSRGVPSGSAGIEKSGRDSAVDTARGTGRRSTAGLPGAVGPGSGVRVQTLVKQPPGAAVPSASPGTERQIPKPGLPAQSTPPTAMDLRSEAARVCLLGIPHAAPSTDVPSLVELVPLIVPFSAEVFAMLPVLQAAIPAIGPLLPVDYERISDVEPFLDQLVPVVDALEQAGFEVLEPVHAPVQPLLEAEKQVALALQPLIASLVTLPGAECVPAVESLLATLLPSPTPGP
ncbi:MAG TPA: hypothetical protein VHJ78_00120 [Actinomycetota bacterium]|nr:hypothetical protein [Actinomycetota bacterium]